MPAFPDNDMPESTVGGSDQSGQDAAFEKMRSETESTRTNKPRRPVEDIEDGDDDSSYEDGREGGGADDDETGPEDDEGEAEGEQQAAPVKKQKIPGYVPYEAVREERSRRESLEAQVREAREREARLDERFRIINEAQSVRDAMAKDEQDLPPDPNVDPIGAIAWNNRKILEGQQTSQAERQRQEQAQQEQQRWNDFTNQARQAAATYIQDAVKTGSDPEAKHFQSAYDHIKERRFAELSAMGYPQNEAIAVLNQEEANVISRAHRAGKNPARAILDLAKVGGWKMPQEDPNKKLDRMEDARRRNGSLSSASGGTAATGEMTARKWLSLPLAEAEAWAVKHPKQYKRLAGG